MSYVLGLDWAGEESWAYCQLPTEGKTVPEVGRISARQTVGSDLLTNALRVVVDAPIGLPDCTKTAQSAALRPGSPKLGGE
jgi:hypothetical protein